MNIRAVFFIFSCLGWLCGCTSSRLMSREDVSYQYRPGAGIKYDLRAEQDSLHVFLKFENKNLFTGSRQTGLHRMSYTVRPDYESKKTIIADSVPSFRQLLAKQRQVTDFNFKLPLALLPPNGVLVLKWQQARGTDAVVLLDIPLTPEARSKRYLLLNPENRQLYYRNHFNLQEPLLLDQAGNSQTFTLKEFDTNFAPARPPMDLAVPNQPKTMALRNSLPWFTDQPVHHTQKGLYQAAFPDNTSAGFLVEENAFPKLTTAVELIQPLIYLTSNQEREKLYQAEDPKAAVDQFWLTIGGSATTARFLIKTYYGRVEAANALFSAHKAGWLTDRGMIYIVFGLPEKVYRTGASETWFYGHRQNVGSLQFVFQKKQNNFTQNYYELIRDRAYEFAWYSTVDKWRNGITDQ